MGPYGVPGSLSLGPYRVPGSRDSWTRDLGSRDSGTRDLGSQDSGSRDQGAVPGWVPGKFYSSQVSVIDHAIYTLCT